MSLGHKLEHSADVNFWRF